MSINLRQYSTHLNLRATWYNNNSSSITFSRHYTAGEQGNCMGLNEAVLFQLIKSDLKNAARGGRDYLLKQTEFLVERTENIFAYMGRKAGWIKDEKKKKD
ncbi:MAG: hypothetical protein AABW80_00095 [Nanoarchaeota archaeon]